MKKNVFAFLMMIFAFVLGREANAQDITFPKEIVTTTKCQYTVDDALAGTKSFVVSGFVPKKTSADGKRVMGMVLFHNPTNKKAESVDAVALVIVEKENPDSNQVILLVSYYNEETQTTTTYLRRLENTQGKQAVSVCFDKSTEKVK